MKKLLVLVPLFVSLAGLGQNIEELKAQKAFIDSVCKGQLQVEEEVDRHYWHGDDDGETCRFGNYTRESTSHFSAPSFYVDTVYTGPNGMIYRWVELALQLACMKFASG